MINDHVYEWLKSKGYEDRLTEHRISFIGKGDYMICHFR